MLRKVKDIRRATEEAKDDTYNEINPLNEDIASLRDELSHTEQQLDDYQKDIDILKRLF